MARFFAFGCSFTSWNWPTWADFYARNFNYYENWGHAGLGNRAIAERVAECNIKNKFTQDDTVIVQWSSHLRHDYMRFDKDNKETWQTKGSLFSYQNKDVFNDDWKKKFFDEKAYFLSNLNSILLTAGLLKSTGCNFMFTSINNLETLGTDIPHQKEQGENLRNTPELANAWDEYGLQEYKYIFDEDYWLEPVGLYAWFRQDYSWHFRDKDGNKWIELHPSPIQHLNWVMDNLSHNLDQHQQIMIDNINNVKTDDYKETIKNITNLKIESWDRTYRGY